ncbi:hypothetical protein T4B_697 [Trichinella pseudospiralis]|uniref:Uncharacterized protein n=1 Tax=Trichinella pseudospiralis TaxID=6337 RepID=A0A0V1F0Q9_TRIPS|nr:hypothetical protein T4A_5625 [Trichinella pseudospiralis]KRZ34989.1 hypothetical protein T4B_697 [Trichinella pseudospiralis]KRZ44152.1 hypothetical protein T4C_13023 [Trichinella pseudospiralis]
MDIKFKLVFVQEDIVKIKLIKLFKSFKRKFCKKLLDNNNNNKITLLCNNNKASLKNVSAEFVQGNTNE